MASDLGRKLWEDAYFAASGIKKSAESVYDFGVKSFKFGFKVGGYLLESAFIAPTRARHNALFLSIKNEWPDSGDSGIVTAAASGALMNYIIIASSGENWKETLTAIALTNTISGFYELGRAKHRNGKIPRKYIGVKPEGYFESNWFR